MTVTPPANPDKIEEAVSAHLAKALDSQRGRAAAAFRAQVSDEGRDEGAALSFARAADARGMRTLKIWAGAASVLAACLAVVVTLQMVARSGGEHTRPFPGSGAGRSDPNVVSVSAPMMDQVDLSRDVDGGTAMLPDNTPVHVVRRQTLRQTQWFDPNEKATYQMMQPGERVSYVKMQPY